MLCLRLADHAGKGSVDKKSAKAIVDQLNRMEETETLHASASRRRGTRWRWVTGAIGTLSRNRRFDLDTLIKSGSEERRKGALAPFLRDTLVGLIYCYYAPPGAQVLLTNPMFVRSHDFIGPEGYTGSMESDGSIGIGMACQAPAAG